MKQFLVKILAPIITSMGVTQADLEAYIDLLSGYIYTILIALIVMIVVMIVAKKIKKEFRNVVRWQAGLAFILVIGIITNMICFGPMYGTLSTMINAGNVELSEETIKTSMDLTSVVGEEGMVLLKNNGLLPLSTDVTNLNVFGWDSVKPLYGGTGSGSSDASNGVDILQSLSDAGYNTNESLVNLYNDYAESRGAAAITDGSGSYDLTLPEPTLEYYTDSLMNEAKDFSDTAVIVIGRPGGEGFDLPVDMYSVINGTYDVAQTESNVPANYSYTNIKYTNNGDYDDFDQGESYLELSNTEEDMVEKVCSEFDNVVVVINSSNTMELGWVDEYEQIGAVILAPGPGAAGFTALGEIINGSVNPSGKTTDTFVKDLMSTPYINNIANHSYNNVDDLKDTIAAADPLYQGTIAFANYVEGIYVGYKYYETASEEGFINFEDVVQYPFGYGLSYTSFEKEIINFIDNGDSISFDVNVTNVGEIAGKDVVEIYFTPPYYNGGIEKASVNLIDYEKTGVIDAGDTEVISFNINKEDMAAYDSQEIKISGGGYILEAGEYVISLRSDSHTVVDEVAFNVEEDIDYSVDGRSTDEIIATNQFENYSRGEFEQLSRANGFENYEIAVAAPAQEVYAMDDVTREAVAANAFGIYDSTLYNNDSDIMPTTGANNGLVLSDLTGKDYDDPMWDELLDQMTFEEMATLVNMGGWQTAEVKSIGKIATADCDGPAGLYNFLTGAYGTAFPCAVIIAQSWNKDLAYEVGQTMGSEYAEIENFGWYGPAMNTHRSAFTGRNFEYYSEDGVLAGHIAANIVQGAADQGVYPYIKHFAVNDQETNRCSFLLTYLSEQALREVYLKPFELAIKNYEGKSLAIMSSFNFIGTKPSCANSDLLNTVLREEWGFEGMVESDYDGSYGYMITDNSIRNGNDLMLGFNNSQSNVLSDRSATAVIAMRQASKNILYTTGNSGYYLNGDPTGGMSNMVKMFIIIDVILAVLILGTDYIVIRRYLKKRNVKVSVG